MAFVLCLLALRSARAQESPENLRNGVVGITAGITAGGSQGKDQGTGFVVSEENGSTYILTARHVFYDKETRKLWPGEISVVFSARPELAPLNAKLVKTDENDDVALIKVIGIPRDLALLLPVFHVRAAAPPLGETVRVFGGKSNQWNMSTGHVTNLESDTRFNFESNGIQSGFSGSPLVDERSFLIGMHLGQTASNKVFGRVILIGSVLKDIQGVAPVLNKLVMAPNPQPAVSPSSTAVRRPGTYPLPPSPAEEAAFANFAVIHPHAIRRPRQPAPNWYFSVMAMTSDVQANAILQAAIKGPGQNVAPLPSSTHGIAGSTTINTKLDDLGEELVVCYTATPDPARPQPMRLTSWYTIDVVGDNAQFVESRTPTLEPATDAPCQFTPARAEDRSQEFQGSAAAFATIRLNVDAKGTGKFGLNASATQPDNAVRHLNPSIEVAVKGYAGDWHSFPVSTRSVGAATLVDGVVDQAGETVVCYTATPAEKAKPLRLTSRFMIESTSPWRAEVVPLGPPVLAPASSAVCR